MIKTTVGHRIFAPLSFAFSMLEKGGNGVQNFSAVENRYYPDRSLTPYVLTPHLEMSDPSGDMTDGDISNQLVDCRWTVDGEYPHDADYIINSDDHSLTVMANVSADESVEIRFTGKFLDKRRGEVSQFQWKTTLTTHENVDYKISLEVSSPKKVLLSPFKMPGTIRISARMLNGPKNIPEDMCSFDWSYWNFEEEQFIALATGTNARTSPPWFISGDFSPELVISPEAIDNEIIRCQAVCKNATKQMQTWVGRFKRYYGRYSEDIQFVEGKYIFPDTTRAVAKAVVANAGGEISSPADFFDIEIFYSRGGSSAFRSVDYGERAEVPRKDFGADATAQHKFGVMVRERSALRPLTINGVPVAVNDTLLMVNEPTSTREV